MKSKLLKIKKGFLNGMLVLTLLTLTSNANATSNEGKTNVLKTNIPPIRTITCTTVAEIKAAMAAAQPGDEIIINSGIFISDAKVKDGINKFNSFSGLADGTAANPIILRGASTITKTILKSGIAPELSTPVLGITGDYWIIKDIEISNGLRGINLDTANNCQLINLEIHTTGQEALHIRSNSSNNLIKNCKIYNTGVGLGATDAGYGEAIYVGSDQSVHTTYAPSCDNNTIEGCILGPNVSAECIDIKEGTQNTIVRNCTFSATGVSNQNSADSFIDVKGGYTFIYNNTFNANDEPNLASCIDFQQRTGTNSGYRIAIFNNTFNLGEAKKTIPTARKKGGTPSEVHIWQNTRNPQSPNFPDSDGTTDFVTESCPSWNIVACSTLGLDEKTQAVLITVYPNPSNGFLNITGIQDEVDLMISDTLGKNVFSKNNVTDKKNIDVSKLANGIYILTIKNKETSKNIKLVINK
jgi:endoglucanase